MTAFTRNTKSACAPACPSSMCVYTIACSEHVSIEQMFFLPSPCEDTDKTRDSRLQLYGAVHITTHTRLISNVVSATVSASPAGVPVGLGGARGVRERDTRADGARVVVLRRQRHRETSRPRDPRRAAREEIARAHSPRRNACARRGRTERGAGVLTEETVSSCVCVAVRVEISRTQRRTFSLSPGLHSPLHSQTLFHKSESERTL